MPVILPYSLSVQTRPTRQPVTLSEAKKQCYIADSESAHDAHLRRLIDAATRMVEADSNRKLITQTWDQKLDCWPDDDQIILYVSPLQSVTSVSYIDTDGNSQTWDSANYSVDTARNRPAIHLAYGIDWPSGSTRTIDNAVTVRAVVGYGDDEEALDTTIPEAKLAVLLLVSHAFDNKTPVITGTISKEIELGYRALIETFAVGGYL